MSIDIDFDYIDEVFDEIEPIKKPSSKWRNKYWIGTKMRYLLVGGGEIIVGPGSFLSPEVFPSKDIAETDQEERQDRARALGFWDHIQRAGYAYHGAVEVDE